MEIRETEKEALELNVARIEYAISFLALNVG